MKNCAICNVKFAPVKHSSGTQRYCTRACAKVGKARLKKKYVPRPPTEEITCKTCGFTFLPKDRRQMFCGPLCNGNHHRRKNKMGGNWVAAMERDKHKCRICSSASNLVVHHIDGSGERESPNHNLENLAVLCRACHCKVHQFTFRIVNGVLILDNPVTRLVGQLPVVFLDQIVTPTMVQA